MYLITGSEVIMASETPKYTKGQINRAGDFLRKQSINREDLFWAFDVLNNWRSCHAYPINTFQATLRHRLKSIDENALVAQRLKRTPSIISKLVREEGMLLSRMQDIGGLRAVVQDIESVKRLYDSYKNGKRLKHLFHSEKDYIANPKESGYRSVHLIYRYKGQKGAEMYDGLSIELQIRTRMQHAWATAVETMGTFLNTPLKSNEGDKQWLDFFSLVSSAFSHMEGTPLVPNYEQLSYPETLEKVISEEKRLQVINQLEAFNVVAKEITSNKQKSTYYLVVLNPSERAVTVTSYGRDELVEANNAYLEAEKHDVEGQTTQVVLSLHNQ
jgi:putative GTP pyrophosphokinase